MPIKYIIASDASIGLAHARVLGLVGQVQIITREEQLRGVEIHEGEYEIVFTGMIKSNLLALLESRIR